MIDFKEIPKDGEEWELFARDFLTELGFYIESSVDRGPDGKKDLIVSEQLKGNLGNYKFKWLVSCKHFANSAKEGKIAKSVQEEDEINISERVKSYNCDGFIGFYSSVPSSGLNTRLTQLKENASIKDYRVFDYKLIENYLIRVGYSELLRRYFPNSYKIVKPLHLVFDRYLPLHCKKCEKDLLIDIYNDNYNGLISFVYHHEIENKGTPEKKYIEVTDAVYWACKDCDYSIERKIILVDKKGTGWEDIGDLVIPAFFIKWILSIMNGIERKISRFSPQAYSDLKYFIMAISQKVMREMTESEKQRFKSLLELDAFGL
jgi:hypothetical protein